FAQEAFEIRLRDGPARGDATGAPGGDEFAGTVRFQHAQSAADFTAQAAVIVKELLAALHGEVFVSRWDRIERADLVNAFGDQDGRHARMLKLAEKKSKLKSRKRCPVVQADGTLAPTAGISFATFEDGPPWPQKWTVLMRGMYNLQTLA